jgi:hypothetical protein
MLEMIVHVCVFLANQNMCVLNNLKSVQAIAAHNIHVLVDATGQTSSNVFFTALTYYRPAPVVTTHVFLCILEFCWIDSNQIASFETLAVLLQLSSLEMPLLQDIST